jgi:cation diffusion facilitator family transporter
MNHPHHPHTETLGRRLMLAMVINLLIPAAQIIGGLLAGSVALISDAVHNLGDFAALMVAYGAHRAAKRGPSVRHTFGLQRIEILAAVVNAALLCGAAMYIASEAMVRLADPRPINLTIVFWLALLGIAGNGAAAWLLHRDSEHNLNARGAFLHMIGDMLTSVAVLVGALVMQVADLPWLDPALSLAIVVYIVWNSVVLVKEAVHVLMNGVPRGLDLEAIKAALESVAGVDSVHYLHAWSMGNRSVALTAHVVVPDQLISAAENLTMTINDVLMDNFGIDHPVLQFETSACGRGELLCRKTGCEPGDNACESHEH